MQIQVWRKEDRHGLERITCVVKEVRMKRGRQFSIIQAVHRAKSDRYGRMDVSLPVIRDIQDAIRSKLRISRCFGYQREVVR